MIRIGKNVKAVAALALLLFMVASASAAWEKQYEHSIEQDVAGSGFSMVRQNVNTGNLELLNYMHGSGTMDAAMLISSNLSRNKHYPQDANTHVYRYDAEYALAQNISFLEQNEMVYSPMAFAYGTGWYEKNPIVYNSKLKEKTWGKNYQPEMGVSMHHQIEYASAFVKDIGVDLQCKEEVPYYDEFGTRRYSTTPEDGIGLARMKIEEEVTEGVVHIGELVAGDGDHGWKNPIVEIDENYVGTFKIQKNMEFTACKVAKKPRPDWLSCCIGGYSAMAEDDRMWGEKEIFDCTCRDVAWGKAWEDKSRAQPL
ncbi:MAG: conserved exported protein of unknown function [Methanothrix sp.]|jgi:hypothetical protein|nr:MAG: conserved exported protein of unknown function [Methanothrix sp.]